MTNYEMTPEREKAILAQARSNAIHGVLREEVEWFEQKYHTKCDSYACGRCIIVFLQKIIRNYNL